MNYLNTFPCQYFPSKCSPGAYYNTINIDSRPDTTGNTNRWNTNSAR